jgi:hypothetical protein
MIRQITAASAAVLCASLVAAAATKTAAGSVTLTGCLRTDGNGYVLTKPEGPDAPKARTWKTAFLFKTTKDVQVAGSSTMKLKDQVNRRVTVTGVKDDDTHVSAKSIKRVASSCS